MSVKSSGTFAGTANGNVASPDAGQINGALWGTFTATVVLEVSFDGGSTWVQAQYPDTLRPSRSPRPVCSQSTSTKLGSNGVGAVRRTRQAP
jgi:hypothetical protein